MSQEIPTSDDSFYDPLTKRELEILTLLAKDLSDQEIAQELHLSLKTVKWYNSTQIYSKLGVKKREDAVNKAQQLGLLVNVGGVTNRHNLPAQTTAFIGREQELSDLSSLLSNSDIRLLTLLAPGGMGKTRLALELAQQDLENYSDGVFFIALAPLSSPSHVVMAIADALELHLQGEEELNEQVKQYIHDKQLLLILDNFEHILEAAPIITEILEVTTQVKVLATSREKLRLSGEKAYAISGMIFPDWETPEDALEYDAVKLFMQGAELASGEFQLDIDELKYLARICRLTEGMPLAIKLAAAWVDVLSLEEIAQEIQASIDFLAVEMRDMPRRQWSIRAVFEPTWKRLTAEQQAVFMKFAVFRSGCTREAAQAITGATLRHLQTFVNKALLSRTPEGRYEIHQLLRQYGAEQLEAHGNFQESYDKHSEYYLNALAEREKDIKGRRQREALIEIGIDFDNARAAWHFAIKHGNYRSLESALECLTWFFIMTLRLVEGVELFQQSRLHIGQQLDAHAHLILLRLSTRFILLNRWHIGYFEDSDKSAEQLNAGLDAAHQAGDQSEIGFNLILLGWLTSSIGALAEGLGFLAESLVQLAASNDTHNHAWALQILGIVSTQVDLDRSIEVTRQSFALFQSQGDIHGSMYSRFNLAGLEIYAGNYSQAELYLKDTVSVEFVSYHSLTKRSLSRIYVFLGDIARARELSLDTLQLSIDGSYGRGQSESLSALGWIACIEGDYDEAKRLCLQSRELDSHPESIFNSEWALSMIHCGLNDYDMARQYQQLALRYVTTKAGFAPLTWCLPVAAILLEQDGETERAVNVLALAYTHPASAVGWLNLWSMFQGTCQRLRSQLGEEAYNTAWEQGKKLDLVTIVEELLADYEENQK